MLYCLECDEVTDCDGCCDSCMFCMVEEVEELNSNTSDRKIVDADTILVDLIQANDFEVSGFAQDIFNVWKESKDKKSVEKMFFAFTGMEFDKYLIKYQSDITR